MSRKANMPLCIKIHANCDLCSSHDVLVLICLARHHDVFLYRCDAPSSCAGPEAGILRTSALSHVFKGKLFPQAHRKEYIELLGKFEVALLLDRNRLLVPSMLPSSPRYTLHHSCSCCPRPSLRSILTQVPRTNVPLAQTYVWLSV